MKLIRNLIEKEWIKPCCGIQNPFSGSYWKADDVVGHAIFASIRLYASIHGFPRAAKRASCGHSESPNKVSEKKNSKY